MPNVNLAALPHLADLPSLSPAAAHEAGMQAATWLVTHTLPPPPPDTALPEVYALDTEPALHAAWRASLDWILEHCPDDACGSPAREYAGALFRQWSASVTEPKHDWPYCSAERIERARNYRNVALNLWAQSMDGPLPEQSGLPTAELEAVTWP